MFVLNNRLQRYMMEHLVKNSVTNSRVLQAKIS